MAYRIPLSYNPIEVNSYTNVLKSYEGVHHNQIVNDFESAIANLTGIPHAVAVNSGTAAIHLALLSLGIGKGDVVLAPTFTYVATINPIIYVGAMPILIDSETETWNMDPGLLENAIKTLRQKGIDPKAIIVVHTYGMPSKMNELLAISEREGIPLIEDAAESLGALYDGKMTGTMGEVGIYSFNNNKAVTTYGGGVLITSNAEVAMKARHFASQAREDRSFYEHKDVGYNYLMSSLNAAMGLSQLPMLDLKNKARRQVFDKYAQQLKDKATFQLDDELRVSNRWLSTILFTESHVKNLIVNQLSDSNIETRPLWKPMHVQPLYQNVSRFLNGNSEDYFNRGLALPSGFSEKGHHEEVIHQVTLSI